MDDSNPSPTCSARPCGGSATSRTPCWSANTVYDVESAKRAGMPCVAVLSGGYGRAELTEAGAVLVVDGPRDLHGRDWSRWLR